MFGLHIHNFRSFQNQDFEFSKVNLLIGTNSSGKSSLLKFLRMLKQSVSNKEENLRLKGDESKGMVDLSNYKKIIYYNDTTKNINFSFSQGTPYYDFFIKAFEVTDKDMPVFDKLKSSITKISVELSKTLSDHKTVVMQIENNVLGKMYINIKNTKQDISFGESPVSNIVFEYKKEQEITKITFDNIDYEQNAFLSMMEGKQLKEQCKEKYSHIPHLFEYTAFMLMIQNYVRNLLQKTQYVNPLTTTPKSNYEKIDDKGYITPIKDLNDLVNILADEAINVDVKTALKTSLEEILQAHGLAKEIKLVRADGIDVMELHVKLTNDGLWNNITEVGYGVALQMPMFFQMLLSQSMTDGEIILLEQPEIHIHPQLHAKFIETLVTAGNKNTYFIETHSPDMIRELQVLVKQKALEPEDVTIHYLTRETTQTTVEAYKIDAEGILDKDLPQEFYDNYYDLSMKLLD